MTSHPMIFAVGIARNCEKTISQTMQYVERAVSPMKVDRWHFVESDSSDETIQTLTDISERDDRVTFQSYGALSEVFIDRISRIAYCREQARAWVLAQPKKPNFTIVVDLDGVAKGLAESSIFHAIHRDDIEKTILTANTKGRYYDIFALRTEDSLRESYQLTENRMLRAGMNPFKAKYLSLIRWQVRISPNRPAIEVRSAFGGLAIYPIEALNLSCYSFEGGSDCEHVSFNEMLSRSGYRFFIEPSIQVQGDPKHTLFSAAIFRPLWILAGLLPNRIAFPLASFLGMKKRPF